MHRKIKINSLLWDIFPYFLPKKEKKKVCIYIYFREKNYFRGRRSFFSLIFKIGIKIMTRGIRLLAYGVVSCNFFLSFLSQLSLYMKKRAKLILDKKLAYKWYYYIVIFIYYILCMQYYIIKLILTAVLKYILILI